jgi:hypothetical protein
MKRRRSCPPLHLRPSAFAGYRFHVRTGRGASGRQRRAVGAHHHQPGLDHLLHRPETGQLAEPELYTYGRAGPMGLGGSHT